MVVGGWVGAAFVRTHHYNEVDSSYLVLIIATRRGRQQLNYHNCTAVRVEWV
jgi:hypothetical protein